jgi:hypothetical protein
MHVMQWFAYCKVSAEPPQVQQNRRFTGRQRARIAGFHCDWAKRAKGNSGMLSHQADSIDSEVVSQQVISFVIRPYRPTCLLRTNRLS